LTWLCLAWQGLFSILENFDGTDKLSGKVGNTKTDVVENTELRQPLLNEYLGREDITFLLIPWGRILLQELTGF